MKIHFTKMHGCGNDYIYVNSLDGEPPHPEKLAKIMSRRRFSVGADGLILICRSSVADAKMRIFNADGSEAEMCGNGVRCVGKYLFDSGILRKTEMSIETKSGIRRLFLDASGGEATEIAVDMGKAETNVEKIPVKSEKQAVIDEPITLGGATFNITCVSMGNPHAVAFVDRVDALNLEELGALFEKNALFPCGVNTEFVEITGKNAMKMRVWERGSGETLACGTGACAAAVAAVLCGRCAFGGEICVRLGGGELYVTVKDDMRVFLRGGAVKVYDGVYEYEYQDK